MNSCCVKHYLNTIRMHSPTAQFASLSLCLGISPWLVSTLAKGLFTHKHNKAPQQASQVGRDAVILFPSKHLFTVGRGEWERAESQKLSTLSFPQLQKHLHNIHTKCKYLFNWLSCLLYWYMMLLEQKKKHVVCVKEKRKCVLTLSDEGEKGGFQSEAVRPRQEHTLFSREHRPHLG